MKSIRISLLIVLAFAPIVCAAEQNNPKVVIQTLFGDIAVELYPNDAPVTVDNFLQYTNSGFYDGLIFHRVIENFMIQGGGFEPGLTKRTDGLGGPIVNESYNGLSNRRGTIAMARTAEPNYATSQFFINHVDNLFLDRENAADGFGYCVFGRTLSGMDVVDFIAQIPTYTFGSMNDVPVYTDSNDQSWWVYVDQISSAPADYWIQGDYNNDGIVNFKDFAALDTTDIANLEKLADNWLQSTNWYWIAKTDLNKDGIINFRDFALLDSYDWAGLEALAGGWLQTAAWYK